MRTNNATAPGNGIQPGETSWSWYARDYGRQAKRSIELAKTRGMWADIHFAYDFARKAAHFGAKELARRSA